MDAPGPLKETVQKSIPFEEVIQRLEQAVTRLESGRLSLEESLATFEEGMELVGRAEEVLGAAEQRVEILLNKDRRPFKPETCPE